MYICMHEYSVYMCVCAGNEFKITFECVYMYLLHVDMILISHTQVCTVVMHRAVSDL